MVSHKERDSAILTALDLRAVAVDLGIVFVSNRPNDSGWSSCVAIGRKDASPSAAFCDAGKDGSLGRYKDSGTGESLNLWELAVKLGRFPDWRAAREHFAKQAGIAPLPAGGGGKPRSLMSGVRFIENKTRCGELTEQWAPSKPPITVEAVNAARGRACIWPAKKAESAEALCIGFPAFRSFKPGAKPCGIIIYRADGREFPAIGKLPARKTHLLRGSRDGWLIFGKDANGAAVNGQAAIDAASVIWCTEGVPDALALFPSLPAGHAVATGFCGADVRSKLPVEMFAGKELRVIGDADRVGLKGAEAFAAVAAVHAARVFLVRLPFPLADNHGRDVRDFLNEGGTFADLERLTADAVPVEPAATDERIEIEITPDEYRVNDAAASAIGRDLLIHQRGGSLVHVVNGEGGDEHGITRPAGSPRIREAPLSFVRDRLTANVRFVNRVETADGVEVVHAHPPTWCVQSVAHRGNWPTVRNLAGIVSVPVLRPDGSILDKPGYDRATGLIYHPCGEPIEVAGGSGRDAARAACELLLNLVADFPFAAPEHSAAWIAFALTPLARYAFFGPAPLYLVDANVRGSGKSLLCDMVGLIATGRDMPRMAAPSDDEECRKKITSLALAGDSLILLDNIAPDGRLGCASLDAALTATSWKDRILGRSEVVELPLCVTWSASGNNVAVHGDAARRIAHVRLQSPEERPEERSGFRHANLKEHVRRNRPQIVGAVLTILREFCRAGRPQASIRPWGSFETWSDLVRQAVVWCGLPDPGETRQELVSRSDREAGSLRDLIEGWRELDSDGAGLTTAEALRRMEDYPSSYERVRTAVVELCGAQAGRLPSTRSLGNKLKHVRGRVVGGMAVEQRMRDGRSVWFIVSADGSPIHPAADNFAPDDDFHPIPFSTSTEFDTQSRSEPRIRIRRETVELAGGVKVAVTHRLDGCYSGRWWEHSSGGFYCVECHPPTEDGFVKSTGEAFAEAAV